jgi:hypothetical protein
MSTYSRIRFAGTSPFLPFWGILFLFLLTPRWLYSQIAFERALKGSSVTQSSIDDVDSKAMMVGNGDINALIYSRSNQSIVMHVSKNDVWDARLLTEKDSPLLRANVASHSWKGGSRPPSWGHPHPTPTPASVVKIRLEGNITGATLDLMHARATIETTSGSVTVRALMQSNVIYIETDKPVTINGFPQSFLPAAEKQHHGGTVSVKQTIPGDIDVPGMDVVTVLSTKSGRHAIAVVNSRESATPLVKASQRVSDILKAQSTSVIRQHENQWQQYWSQSGVRLGDADLQNWWYRQQYYLRCLSKPDGFAIALQGGYNSKPNWHGSWTMNYNAQQTFWAAFSSNHPDLAKPFINLVNDYHPRAQWYARTIFDCEGAATPHNFWPFEPDPAKCKSVNKRQFAYMPWSYGIGTAGHVISIPWLYYDYTRDTAYLETTIYPLLKDYADFYASFVEQCRQVNGVVIFGPSVDPEHTPFGHDNSPYDLAWARRTLQCAIQAAADLDTDAEPAARWSNALRKLPAYPTSGEAGEDIVQVPGVKEYNIITPVVPVFPAEQVSWFSPEEERNRFKRTIRWIDDKYNRNNSVVMLNVARARFSMTEEAIRDTKTFFKDKEQPNGLFYWKAHGYYMSEQTAIAGLINDFLLQSVGGIIRIFPSWPAGTDAAFHSLRTSGGFLVSATQTDGKIPEVTVQSTAGGMLRVLSPWPTMTVQRDGRVLGLKIDDSGIMTLRTRRNERLVFREKR